jgi:hypothetical protein
MFILATKAYKKRIDKRNYCSRITGSDFARLPVSKPSRTISQSIRPLNREPQRKLFPEQHSKSRIDQLNFQLVVPEIVET